MEGYLPDNEDTVMFSRDTNLLKEHKISFRAEYRGIMIRQKLESVIHTAAEHLIDSNEQLKVTPTRIESTKLVQTSNGPAPVRSIRKYMSHRTRRIIYDHNEGAAFKSEKSYIKFLEFLEIPQGSLMDKARILGVSKSTVLEFSKLDKEKI
jgi:hypothetical protein